MQTVKTKVTLIAIFLLLSPLQLFALSTDGQQPIQVEADRLEVRDKDNISIYSGNVSLKQGSLEFRSDRLTLYFDDAKELTLMEMTGNPATFRQSQFFCVESHARAQN